MLDSAARRRKAVADRPDLTCDQLALMLRTTKRTIQRDRKMLAKPKPPEVKLSPTDAIANLAEHQRRIEFTITQARPGSEIHRKLLKDSADVEALRFKLMAGLPPQAEEWEFIAIASPTGMNCLHISRVDAETADKMRAESAEYTIE